jgi:5-oxopent-3-ene-1,2,5-tricarboxylate decarboxylase/2-hydroxyhepta-2,4-diene-1,7-dioate isomerase
MTHWQPRGTVYGTLLNFQREWSLWQERMTQDPHKAAPNAPVLYIKSANTFCPAQHDLVLQDGVQAVEIGATLGLVMGPSTPYSPHVKALALLNDWSVPHASYFRPPVKHRCRDGFLALPAHPTPISDELTTLHQCQLQVFLNDTLVQTVHLHELVRDIPTLLKDVHEFMTLQDDDVLMIGTDMTDSGQRVLAHAGDTVRLHAEGLHTDALCDVITTIRSAT